MDMLSSRYGLGDIPLRNRFVMAPMTRSRAQDEVAAFDSPIGQEAFTP